MKQSEIRASSFRRWLLPLSGSVLLLFHTLGWLFPDQFWATNYLAYLPGPWSAVLLGLAALLLLGTLLKLPERLGLSWPTLPVGGRLSLLAAVVAVLFGMLCYAYPIADDNYGNAGTYHAQRDEPVTVLPPGGWGALFQFELTPGQGRRTVYQVASLTAYYGGTTLHAAYRLIGATCGALFAGLWLWFCGSWFKDATAKWIMAMAGLSAPMVQLFFGHLESYAPVLLLLTGWLLLLLHYFRDRKGVQLWGLLPLLLLGLRLNSLFLLLLPVLALVLLQHFLPNHKLVGRLMHFRGMVTLGFLPLGILGLLAYFFVFGDHNDPRVLEDFRDIDRLFLPLVSPAPPLDGYNLFSSAHLFDFLSVLLFSSPVFIFLFPAFSWEYRRRINWNAPALVAVAFAVLLLGSMLFMMNPLFSMPMDWDLFSLLTPLLLVLLAILLRQLGPIPGLRNVLPACLGFALLVIPVITVNTLQQPHAARLLSVGRYIYPNYYCHSDKLILYALISAQPEPATYLAREKAILEQLAPAARKGNDPKYANLLLDHGLTLLQTQNDLSAARDALVESDSYAPLAGEYQVQLLEVHFRLGEFEQAHQRAESLLVAGYPSPEKALRMALHTALEADLYPVALQHSAALLARNPEDQFIRNIHTRLENQDQVEQLKTLFRRN